MNSNFSFCINFSAITLKFTLPEKINLPECFLSLLCEDTDTPDAEYRVELLRSPLCPEGDVIYAQKDFTVYAAEDGFLRVYTPLTADDGCCVACLIRKNGQNVLYYPESMWKHYSSYWHCTHLLCGELLLRNFDAALLHSSVVLCEGKTLLFCGASGMGKSTQADLWKTYQNAEIINGDRAVITKKDNTFYAGGSIWCGTSHIYRRESAPIAGIFVLKKHTENTVRPLKSEAFTTLFSQTTVNQWDKDFVDFVCSLYIDLLSKVPVYELACRPDKAAVDLAYNTIFNKEGTP